MTGFAFDPWAALARIRERQALPNRPNLPNRIAPEADGLGGLGRLGAVRASDPEPATLARDIYEERAAIREFDGGQDRAEAERAAWHEAQRAAVHAAFEELEREADDPLSLHNWR